MKKLKPSILIAGLLTIAACNKKETPSIQPIANKQSANIYVSDSLSIQTLPQPDHVVICIMENHSASQIIGSSSAPYINALAVDAASANFTNSFAITHPSQPNYLYLYSGSNQGVISDFRPWFLPFTTANLGKQLLNAGKTFITYAEDLPSVGYNGNTSGAYVRKHNPATNWMGMGTNQIPATTNQPFTAFPSTFSNLPTVCYVIPNLNNDMHDGTIFAGDQWLQTNLDAYIQWAKTHNSLFILTFDEDDNGFSNKITTIFTGAMVLSGNYSNTINHCSILKLLEDMYGLPYAGNVATANSINYCWK